MGRQKRRFLVAILFNPRNVEYSGACYIGEQEERFLSVVKRGVAFCRSVITAKC